LISFKAYSGINPLKIKIQDAKSILQKYNDPSITRDIDKNFFHNLVITSKDKVYYNPDGTLHLFELKFDDLLTIKKLSKGIYHGHNFSRHLFTHNSKIFSYGGEGLFDTFSGLIEFNFKSKEWFKKEIKNYPTNAKKVISSWIYGNILKVLITKNVANSNSKKIKFCFGTINLSTLEFQEIGNFYSSNSRELYCGHRTSISESSRYTIVERRELSDLCRYEIFDKKNGEFIHPHLLKEIPCIDGNSYTYIKDSTLYYSIYDGKLDSVILNENSIYKKNKVESLYYNLIHEKPLEPNSMEMLFSTKYNLKILFLMLFLVLLISAFIITKIRKKKNSDENINVIEKNLIKIKGTVLSRDKLDSIFEISHLGADTIKSQRSAIIKKVNDNKKIEIGRLRKKDDKRFFEYSIS
jgi:hypothetical protein